MAEFTETKRGKRMTVKDIEDEKDAVDLLDSLQREAQGFRDRGDPGHLSLEVEWEQNGHRFLGNHWLSAGSTVGMSEGYRAVQFTTNDETGIKGLKRSTLNRTQNSVIANTGGQTQFPTVIRLEPEETEDRPIYFMSPEGGRLLHKMLAPVRKLRQEAEQQRNENTDNPQLMQQIDGRASELHSQVLEQLGLGDIIVPDDDQLVESIDDEDEVQDFLGPSKPLTFEQGIAVQKLVDAGLLPKTSLISINDDLITSIAQKAFDQRWRVAGGEQKLVMNELFSNIYGNQWMRFQWNHDGPMKHTFTLENTHILNVWVDHTHQFIGESDYVIFDYPISLDQAKAHAKGMWSHVKGLEDDLDSAATDGVLDDAKFRRGGLWSKSEFKRKMVVVRTGWVRWQDVPMTIEQAIDEDLVVEREENDLEPAGYTLVETGEDVDPPDEDSGKAPKTWPTTSGIRQIVILPQVERTIEDRACPYWDIPFALNINVPRPDGGPYGQGEPMRLEDISQQINRLLSILDNHSRYYQFPQRYWRQSTLEKLRVKGFQLHSRPGAEIPIPDEDWRIIMSVGGFDRMTQRIPSIPGAYVDLLERLLKEHDRLSGDVEVRQGVAPFSGASGALVDSLRQEAAGPLAFKSKFTEWMVERIGKLAVDAIVRWMPIEEWQKLESRFERPIWESMLPRMRMRSWNFRVETATGRGINTRIDEERAINLYQAGAPSRLLSRETAMARVRVPDPNAEGRRIDSENQKAGMTPSQQAGGGISLPPKPQSMTPEGTIPPLA
jgi:hypothetical protein